MRRSLSLVLTIVSVLFMFIPADAEEAGMAYYDFGVFAYEDGNQNRTFIRKTPRLLVSSSE